MIAAVLLLAAAPLAAQTPVEVGYGPNAQQTARLFLPAKAKRAPLLVYLHGGGWNAGAQSSGSSGQQAAHWTGLGYAYATIGYRLMPDATVEGQLGDVAQAIARLRRQKGVDAKRLVLIGHSSGATMAAQLGTDPAWLTKADVPFGTVKAVVLLDPSVLDVPALLAQRDNPGVEKFFRRTFGDDVAYQTKLSPVAQAGGPDAPHWLMVTDQHNDFSNAQSAALVAALKGKDAAIVPVADTNHMKLNREIGAAGDAATAAIDAFLARVR